ncbi:MAG: hypothetical protein WD341_20245 [Tistlia sp.]|uniref:hypothetical protein n=1 Tax=Tistlia sp. TaxID=3057121 RepID=UPI0034A1630C
MASPRSAAPPPKAPAPPLCGLAAAVAAAFCLLAPAGPARADCSVPGYAAAADHRFEGWPPCDELDSFNVQTPRGPRQVRMIGDRNLPSDWHEPVRLTREAIVRSADTLREIGSGTVPNLLVLITGLLPSETPPDPSDPEAVAADRRTRQEGVADGRSGEECLLVVYPGNVEARDLGFVVAHEFFHCVQYALARPQMTARDDGRPDEWWVEGSAEWFANLAYPESDASASWLTDLDSLTPDRALSEAAYEAFAFWSWYAREWSPAAVLEYLPRTPTAGGAGAQLQAAAQMIAEDRWLAFVRDYLDRQLRYPDARRLPVSPRPGETFLWTETGEEQLEGERLALYRSNLVFTCGKWRIESEEAEGVWKVRKPDRPGDWQELPERLEVEPGKEERYLLGGVGPGEEGFRLTVTATREAESEADCPCDDFAETARARGSRRDACLVGTWQLASGGLVEWLDRALKDVHRSSGSFASYDSETDAEDEGRRLFLGADGRYHYGTSTVSRREEAFTEKGDRFASHVEGLSGGAGYWATREGMLEVCAASEASGAVATLELKEEVMTLELPGYLSEHLYSGGYHYSCGGGALALRHLEIPGTPTPMEWHYRKVD